MSIQCNLYEWVEREDNPVLHTFRAAVHIILHAIATNQYLRENMFIKGGMLLSFRYQSPRVTRDIDFSTRLPRTEYDHPYLVSKFEAALPKAVEDLHYYGIDCILQSTKINPKDPNSTFPTISVNIGYAHITNRKRHARLLRKNSSEIVRLDYSLNEQIIELESLQLLSGGEILAYSLPDLIAEKYRAILQQKARNRYRRQDAFDLYMLLKNQQINEINLKKKILTSIIKKSNSRDLEID